MMFGDDLILGCPKCESPVRLPVQLSGNTFGATFWSDGSVDAPELPTQPLFETCRGCGHDYWLEDQREKTRKPNYTRRRILFAIVSIGLISSLTIMLTWHGGSTTAALMVEGVYIATALWLIVRFAPRD